MNWMRRARLAAVQHNLNRAEMGDARAQYDLAERYHDGLGMTRNYSEALRWFLKAAQQGHAKARLNAGMMLFLGRGHAPDEAEAVKWLVLASEGGEAQAKTALDAMVERLAPEVADEGRRRARSFIARP